MNCASGVMVASTVTPNDGIFYTLFTLDLRMHMNLLFCEIISFYN